MLNVVAEEWKDSQFALAHAVRPCPGEFVSGDEVLLHRNKNYILIGLIDGLGHGRAASEVSKALKAYFEEQEEDKTLEQLVKNAHQQFIGTRGAVVALVRVFENGYLEYVGVGNIRARIIRNRDNQLELIPKDGAVGIRMRNVATSYENLGVGDCLLLFSDGVSRNLIRQSVLMPKRNPVKFARKIIDAYGKMHDDASVIYLIKTDEEL